MYLEHFGLSAPPFRITPVTDFFFPGANRGEVLDALIYAITENEGIIKVSGEVGSGKTMLCRMLLERLPPHVEAVYLANPSLSREEMLYAIADGLGLDLEGKRVNIILQTLQNELEQKISQGKRVVILVDEAHAMPLETLEELRLLYNMQKGDHKLLHIVLFGQPELNDKLAQPNMRQLKDRIIHHFNMLPLSQNIIESYLLFRMRTAGYRGPTIFSSAAAALIGKASQGLMRRVNILADKSLLAAFVENTHNIDVRHVQAAIRDSELSPTGKQKWSRKTVLLATASILAVLAIAMAVWLFSNIYDNKTSAASTALQAAETGLNLRIDNKAPAAETPPLAQNEPNRQFSSASAVQNTAGATAAPTVPAAQAAESAATPVENAQRNTPLLQQRLAAAREMLHQQGKGSTSIQLFYTEDIQPLRMEGFLKRANGLGKLAEIYVLPSKINGHDGYRILYGSYRNSEDAHKGMKFLPQRYKDAFDPVLYTLDDTK